MSEHEKVGVEQGINAYGRPKSSYDPTFDPHHGCNKHQNKRLYLMKPSYGIIGDFESAVRSRQAKISHRFFRQCMHHVEIVPTRVAHTMPPDCFGYISIRC